MPLESLNVKVYLLSEEAYIGCNLCWSVCVNVIVNVIYVEYLLLF